MTQLIELTPLADFFFGSEATFGQGDNRHYYVRSKLWPQQTTLLGMLRYELLKSEPKAFDVAKDEIIDQDKATALVGPQGFNGAMDTAFGLIEGISPVFLLNPEGVPYFLRSRAFLEHSEKTWLGKKAGFKANNLLAKANEPAQVDGYQLNRRYQNKKGETIEEPYDGKVYFEEFLMSQNGKFVPLKEVFIKIHKTGNRKEYNGASDDSGFFKQDLYQLKSGWRFAFLVELTKDFPTDFGTERKVQIGAERRLFRLSAHVPTAVFRDIVFEQNCFKGFDNLYGPDEEAINPELSQVVLLSDASVVPAINNMADFASTESVSFRHLNANLDNPNKLWTQHHTPKSSLYHLLQRGSVLYAKDPNVIETELKKAAAFRRIGYNYFKTITAQSI